MMGSRKANILYNLNNEKKIVEKVGVDNLVSGEEVSGRKADTGQVKQHS